MAALPKETKFIQFGCWNNMNGKGCLDRVVEKITSKINDEEKKYEFLVVSGDNYYPDKKETVKTASQGREAAESVKTKIIHPARLTTGFDLIKTLPIDIKMILGNHDLETNTKNNLYIEQDGDLVPEVNGDCSIIKLEINELNGSTIDYQIFNSISIGNTLILMIDTSMYEMKSTQFLPCYKSFISSNHLTPGSYPKIDTLKDLLEFQKENILGKILEHNGMYPEDAHIIIIGHHPIIQRKLTKIAPIKQINTTDIPNILPLLSDIYGVFKEKAKYNYLCSDLHLYQQGIIEIGVSGGEHMSINQYIVGTGGTKLDKPLTVNLSGDEAPDNFGNTIYIPQPDIAECGFLECSITDRGPSFTPIFVDKL